LVNKNGNFKLFFLIELIKNLIFVESRLNLKKRNALEKNFTTIVNSEKSVDIPTHEKKTKMSSFRYKIIYLILFF